MKIIVHYLAIAHAINKAVQNEESYRLTPKVYRMANKHLKLFVNGKYHLNVKASADTTAIVEYCNVDYYLYYDYPTKKYVCEKFKL